MASYWINLSGSSGGAGTEFSPWNSTSSLPTLAAGDTVNFRGEGDVQYTVSGSGTAGSPITIRKDPASPLPPVLHPTAQAAKVFTCTSKSNVRFEDLDIVAPSSWTHQDTTAIFLNGAGSGNYATRVRASGARFEFAGGFNMSDVRLMDCQANDCNSDGVRFFSGTGTYAWDGILIQGGSYSRNGKAQGANGSGISFLVQSGHTATEVKNVRIDGVVTDDNYRYGTGFSDGSVAWATLIAAGNTTAPTKQFKGLEITSVLSRRNGDAGISVLGAQPGTSMLLLIRGNRCEDNSVRSTIGNIWTGGCLRPIIERNVCLRAYSNGTVVGDGQGIFDDQWNDGAIVRWNEIANNVFQAFNPDYSSYGIGVFRCANSKHYGNVISGVRHGFYIGTVTGATAPTMSGIEIFRNTIADFTKTGFVLIAATPASALTIRNNLLIRGDRDVEAQSSGAGSQTFTSNYAVAVTTKYTGNNVGASAFDHTLSESAAMFSAGYRPLAGSPLLTAGASTYSRDKDGRQARKFIGAYGPATLRPDLSNT